MKIVTFAVFLGRGSEFDRLLNTKFRQGDFFVLQLACTTMALGQQIMLFSLYVCELFELFTGFFLKAIN